MEANSNKASRTGHREFRPRGWFWRLANFLAHSKVAISTGPGPSTRPFPSSHQPSASVDEHYQPFDQSNTFLMDICILIVNTWQPEQCLYRG